jgi:hypothetical protein
MSSFVFMLEDDHNSSTNLLFDNAYTYCQHLTNEVSHLQAQHTTRSHKTRITYHNYYSVYT